MMDAVKGYEDWLADKKRREYNRIWMQQHRHPSQQKARTAKLIAQGKCPKCEIIIAMHPGHNCDVFLMPGWKEVTDRHGDWGAYFHYYELETDAGAIRYHRRARKGFEYLEHMHGGLEDVRKEVAFHNSWRM